MALQVWLLLNGDLHNQGLYKTNITSSNYTTNSNGKIGSCIKTNTTDGIDLQYSGGQINNGSISFGGWFKFNKNEIGTHLNSLTYTDTRTTATGNLIGNNSYGGISLQWWSNNMYSNGPFSTISVSTYVRSTTNGARCGAICALPFDTWTHIMLVYDKDKNKCHLYLDGILKNSYDQASFTDAPTTNLWLNKAWVSGGNGPGAYIPFYCNDLRIYDHCLSAQEVREISKGLVLHYQLNNNGLDNTNLALNTRTLNISSSKTNLNMYIRSSATRQLRNDGFYESKCTAAWQGLSFWANQLNLAVGTKVTYSFYIYGNGSSRAFSFYPMMFDSGGTRDTSTGLPISIDGGSYTTANSKTFGSTTATTPEYHYVTFEWNQAVADIISNGGSIELSIQVHGTWNSGDWVCIFAPKVELGEKPTKWSPNPADIGMENIIYDSSGFNNNGTIVNNLTINPDAIKYNCSTKFIANSYIRVNKKPSVCLPKDAITVNFWAKTTTWGNPISCTEGGGWNIENGSSGLRFPVYISSVGYKYQDTTTTVASLNGAWHMITGTMDKDNVKTYIDGELKSTVATGSTNGIGYANNYLFINAEAAGDTTSPASASRVGSLSDIRIYATALSADDIKELYRNSKIASGSTIKPRDLE